MNGYDFNYRVLRPWERDPAYYQTLWMYQSDVPAHEGPTNHGVLEFWMYDIPLDSESEQKMIKELKSIPPFLNQAKINLTGNAKELWEKIIAHAHSSAEPGLLFWDTMTDYHNAEYCSPLVSTNPCAEQPLPDGGCCNLGALNLERFVDNDGNFMIDEFKDTVSTATRFLDNVIDYNLDRHALESQKQNAINDRRVG